MEEGKEGYTPEQLEAEKSRTLSDAELINTGAEYGEKEGQKMLVLTPEQIDSIQSEHNKEVLKTVEARFYHGDLSVEDIKLLEQLQDYPGHLNDITRIKLIGPEARKANPDHSDKALVGHLDFIHPDSMRSRDGERLRGRTGVNSYDESYDVGGDAVASTLVMRSDIMDIHLRRQVFNKDKEGNYSVDEVKMDIPDGELESMGWNRKRID